MSLLSPPGLAILEVLGRIGKKIGKNGLPGVKRMEIKDGKGKQREIFLDKLRAAATCAVVLLHTVTGVMDASDMSLFPLEKKVFLVVMDLVCWSVPVFLLISGYLFLNPERKISFRTMVTKYCRRILLALFLFGVPYACLEQIAAERAFRPEMLLKGFCMVLKGQSWSHMWYLYLIFFLYLLTPALKLVLRKLPRKAVYLLAGAVFTASAVLPFVKGLWGAERLPALPEEGIYFFYYICGYLFVSGKNSGGQRREEDGTACERGDSGSGRKPGEEGSVHGWRRKLVPAAACVLAAAMAVSRIAGFSFQMAYNYPFTAALALLLFAWGLNARSTEKNTGFWESASALSFGVYLIHPVFLNLYYKFLNVTPLSFPVWASLPLFFLGALLPAALGVWVLRKLPFMRRYVL